MIDTPHSFTASAKAPVIKRPRLSNWVWHLWYAKLWWSLIAAYWTVGAGALLYRPIADFYTSSFASFLNVMFYPVFALIFLSMGWVRAWIGALDYAAKHPDAENQLGWHWSTEPLNDRREMMRSHDDPSDPTSSSYVANATLRRIFDS